MAPTIANKKMVNRIFQEKLPLHAAVRGSMQLGAVRFATHTFLTKSSAKVPPVRVHVPNLFSDHLVKPCGFCSFVVRILKPVPFAHQKILSPVPSGALWCL